MATFRFRQSIADYDLLPPEPKAQASASRRLRSDDAIDVDFIELADPRPPSQRFRYNDNRPSQKSRRRMPAFGLAVEGAMAAVTRAEQRLRRLPDGRFSAVVAMFAAVFFLLAGGLAGIAGASAPGPRDDNPLDITHISLASEDADGLKVLVVRGIVENRSGGSVTVPDIRADLLSGERLIASTIIAPPIDSIYSGHSRGFAARLPHPGGKDPQIKLSFATPAVAQR